MGAILAEMLAGRFTLLFAVGIAEEIRETVAERPHLSGRITSQDVQSLITSLDGIAEEIPRIPEPYPAVSRDRKDDFLIAHAVLGGADFLVSWDRDLLDLGAVDGVAIVDPPRFLAALRAAGADR